MKNIQFDFTYSILAMAAAVLLSYCTFSIAEGDENDYVIGIGSLVSFTLTFVPIIGMKHTHSGVNVNLYALSLLFVVMSLFSNFGFAIFGVAMPYYAVVNGLILILYLVMYLKIANADIKHG